MNKGKAHYLKRKEYALNYLGGRCVVCSTKDNLQFDHIDPSTKVNNATWFLTKSLMRLHEELAKCQLLCVEHHKEKTKSNKEYGQIWNKGKITHGISGYRLGCKCNICKELYSLARKERYRRLKV